MANQSTTGFGLRPLRKVGQNDNNAGLGEFQIASGATAIYHHDLVLLAGSGYVTVTAASPNVNNLGSFNGVYLLILLLANLHGRTIGRMSLLKLRL